MLSEEAIKSSEPGLMELAIQDLNLKLMDANKKGGVNSQEKENQISDEWATIIN